MSKNILIIGSGPIIIGQACEFDYSGVQAVNTIKKLGYKAIIINNNPASIMTDKTKNTTIYMEPININTVTQIIKKEHIKLILPNMGGQTALNIASMLKDFKQAKLKILGASIQAIINAEDRNKFRTIMQAIHVKIPKAYIVNNLKSAIKARDKLIKLSKKPIVVIRTSYTLGGSGGGIIKGKTKFKKLVEQALKLANTQEIIIEESLMGDKEYELEILIDKHNNFINICTIENIDKTGIHTGDSITITPAQTITNYETQKLRNTAKTIITALKIKNCGANIQFSINTHTHAISVIEVNPRISRSSALASKATGYPIAKIATLLSLGKPFTKITQKIAGRLPAFFEPAIDYIAIKIPKFCNNKFKCTGCKLSTQMKSVGEVLAINNNLESTLQYAITGIKSNQIGFENLSADEKTTKQHIKYANELRLNGIFEMYKLGISKHIDIDKFYLNKIRNIAIIENKIVKLTHTPSHYNKNTIITIAKTYGFSDERLKTLLNINTNQIKLIKQNANIVQKFLKIDTCAKEFNTNSSYIYGTYNGINEIQPMSKNILIIGSGPNKIGQGLEFDYCCVHAVNTIKKLGYKAIIINNNPETVSTDSDVANRLYLLPITNENIEDIYKFEHTYKLLIQFCGQLPISMLKDFKQAKLKILGASIQAIINAEDRNKFRTIMQAIHVKIPKATIIKARDKLNIQYLNSLLPVVVRPSYVLGGENMKVITNKQQLQKLTQKIDKKKYKHIFPILIDKFITKATEYDIDCITIKGITTILPILKHIEALGIHSGDSKQYISKHNKTHKHIKTLCNTITSALKIEGFCNIQIGKKNQQLYVIEVNARASRTIPFLNKATNMDYIKLCIKGLIQKKYIKLTHTSSKLKALKTPIFSNYKFENIDVSLGPEMKSTGEEITFAKTIHKALLKSQINEIRQLKKILIVTTLITKDIRGIINAIHKNASNKIQLYCNKNLKLKPVKYIKQLYINKLKQFDISLIFETPQTNFKQAKIKLNDQQIKFITDPTAIKMFVTAISYKHSFKVKNTNEIF